jgi:hypothetical protein
MVRRTTCTQVPLSTLKHELDTYLSNLKNKVRSGRTYLAAST